MTLVNPYASLLEIHAWLHLPNSDVADDTLLENAINAVSRWIDSPEGAGHRFYTTATDETRLFSAFSPALVYPGDLLSLTTLQTDDDADGTFETTWTSAEYKIWPPNASLDSRPYQQIIVPSWGERFFPTGTNLVRVVGKFGFSSSTPDPVKEACLIQVARIYKRKDSPYGLAGGGEMGQAVMVGGIDPDVPGLLRAAVRRGAERGIRV